MAGRDEGENVETTGSFVALVIYPSTRPAQIGQATTLLRMAEDAIRSMPGFIAGRVFLSEDGEHVISMVEWRDRESFAHFRQSEFGRAGVQLATELHPKAYWLHPYATVGPSKP
jgi:heme-degrading monooxygenase HmoA